MHCSRDALAFLKYGRPDRLQKDPKSVSGLLNFNLKGKIYGIFKTNAGQQPVQFLFCPQRKPPYGRSGNAAEPDVSQSF